MAYNPADILEKEPTKAQKARRENRAALRTKQAEKQAAAKERQDKFLARAKKRRFAITCCAVLLIIVIFMALRAYSELSAVQAQKLEKEAEKAALQAKEEALKEELTQVDSDEYVEDQARSELHMIREGETLYVVDVEGEE